jgi:arabinofuranosyltransferase
MQFDFCKTSVVNPKRARPTLLTIAVALILVHCWWFSDFTVDDGAISFTYARNMALGHGLVLLPGGEHVEGYTNFLWVVLLALGVRFGMDVFRWSHVLGGILAGFTILGIAELVAAVRGRRSTWDAAPAFVGATLLPIAYWSMSGLEGGLYCTVVIWTFIRLVVEHNDPSRHPWSAPLAACIALTRPDGLLLVALALVLRLIHLRRLRELVTWTLFALGPVAIHLAWRIHFYAYPLPNTFYAKVGAPFKMGDLLNLRSAGWKYVLDQFSRYRLLALAAPSILALLPGQLWKMRAGLVVGVCVDSFFSPSTRAATGCPKGVSSLHRSLCYVL